MPVTCKIEVADSGNGDIPPRTWSWTVDANEDGSLIINVPDRGEGNLSLKLDAVGKDKARYGGKKDMSFDDLRTMQQSVSWTVERRPLSLELFFKWDEKFSREAFRPDVGGAIFSHVVVVSGPDRHETIMDGKGCARFYGLKSGEYAVGLTDAGKAMYSVKEASKSVTIPTKGDGPVKAEVSLAPVKVIQLSGRVVDATDGLPVANAILLAGNSAAKAGKDGKFFIQGVIGDGPAMIVQHPSFWPGEFKIQKVGDQGDLRMNPLPSVSGKIVQGAKDSPAPYAVLEFRGSSRRIKAVADDKGQYATRMFPGKYQLTIEQRYQPKDDKLIPANSPKVLVYDTSVEVPPAGLKMDFKVDAVGELTVTIGGASKAGGKQVIVALLRLADRKIVTACQLDAGKETVVLVAREGEYHLLVAQNEQTGQICGKAKVEAGATREQSITLGPWKLLTIASDGTVRFAREK